MSTDGSDGRDPTGRAFLGWPRRTLLGVAILGLIVLLWISWRREDRGGPTVTISKETTYILEPLREDGFPDYGAALNRRFSEGVTPENNAAVLFWKAVGPRELPPEQREKFFAMLGIPPLPEGGDYFVSLESYMQRLFDAGKLPDAKMKEDRNGAKWDQLDPAMRRAWSKQEIPLVASWLEANERPLALLREASKRPRRYDPLAGGNKAMILDAARPAALCRRVAEALVARATLRAQEGKLDEACEDLVACRRLARLVGQGSLFTGAVISLGAEHYACAGDQVILQHAQLSRPQIARMRDDLARLPPMRKLADALDDERLLYLDCATTIAREGPASLEKIFGTMRLPEPIVESLAGHELDWNLILRVGNSWYDREMEAMRRPTRNARKEDAKRADADFSDRARAAGDWPSKTISAFLQRREGASQRMAMYLLGALLPGGALAVDMEDRARMEFELSRLGFALAAYRADNGFYPAKLADLTPKYVAEVPQDIFKDAFFDAELHYTREGDGYVLYSVGSNGKDDWGKTRDDDKEQEGWDDIAIRASATKQAEKPEP